MSENARPDRSGAVRFVLEAFARETDVHDIVKEFGPLGRFSSGDVRIEHLGIAADAPEHGRFTRSDPLRCLELRERYLPEVIVRGKKENYKSDRTLRPVAALAGGVDPASMINSACGGSWTWRGGRPRPSLSTPALGMTTPATRVPTSALPWQSGMDSSSMPENNERTDQEVSR